MIIRSVHFTLLECPSPIRATPTLEMAKVTMLVERVSVAQAMWLGNVFCQVQQRVTSPRGETESLDYDLEFVLKVIESLVLTAIALRSYMLLSCLHTESDVIAGAFDRSLPLFILQHFILLPHRYPSKHKKPTEQDKGTSACKVQPLP